MAGTQLHAGICADMIQLAYDRVFDDQIGYPNLARFNARPFTKRWHEFGHHYPYTVPLRLCHYFQHNNIQYQCLDIDHADASAWYPVACAWFDFQIDYIALIPHRVLDLIRSGQLRLMFYYHEGDNPTRIHQRLEALCEQHQVPVSNWILISANSACTGITNQFYFDDHEYFFRYVNRHQLCESDREPRYDFTVLARKATWWRISILADLWGHDLLANSLWSYDLSRGFFDQAHDNPISIHEIPCLAARIDQLRAKVQHRCDDFDSQQQNDHHWVNLDLYTKSFFQIVLETHLDADQSGGAFLTEKTYKCIKYGQPFLIAGTQNTLAVLREHGYRVFDHVIDNSYDSEPDPTKRWLALRSEIARIKTIGTKILYAQCEDDLAHNRRLFHSRGPQGLSSLLGHLDEKIS